MTFFDLNYATVDSLAEGVGSSQIIPLVEKLAAHGMKINLTSFEKQEISSDIQDRLSKVGVQWSPLPFIKLGPIGGLIRTFQLSRLLPNATITHARSDFPAVAAGLSRQERVLWDVRSLWADQRKFIEKSIIQKGILSLYAPVESLACHSSSALSTLTNAVVPVLEERHKNLPTLRTVVPTAVDLDRFKFSPFMPLNLKGLYSGTYNNYYDLELSRKFVLEIRKIVSCDVDWARPRESQLSKLNAGEVRSFSVSQPEMAQLMSEYTFGLSICKFNAGPSLKAAMPTKIAEFLAIGRPIVVNAGLGDCDNLIENSGTGIVLRENDNLSQKAADLVELCMDPSTPERCRKLAESHFSLEKGVKSYLYLYRQMTIK